jgi:hypothetical protein
METNRPADNDPDGGQATPNEGHDTSKLDSAKLLSMMEFYEDFSTQNLGFTFAGSALVGKELTDEVVEEALEKIVEKELRGRMPGNISDALGSYLCIGLELYFKTYDKDSESMIKNITDPDDEPLPIAMDSWGRSNLPQMKAPSVQAVDNLSYSSAKHPDFKDAARKDIRVATEKAHKYLSEFDEAKMPKPIPLNEKVEEIGTDEIEVRNKKERQIKDQRETEKKKQEEDRKKKDQEKLIQQAEKSNAGENQSIITYAYDGSIMISNKRQALEKLNNVILPTKIVVKNPEVEKSEADQQKNRAKEKKEKPTLPKLGRANKQALEEVMAKSSFTSPNINEGISLTNGVTLIQNGRTKSNTSRLELRFNQTGTLRLNKEDFKRMQEDKRKLREKRLGELKGRGKKKDGGIRVLEDETSKRPDTETYDEDLPFATQTMKVTSMKQLRALRDLAGPDTTFTTFNNTAQSDFKKIQKETENRRRMRETFMQSHTDTFNMEIMRGTVEQGAKSKISRTTQAGSIVPHESRIEAKRLTEDKMQVLPRNRSQKVMRQHHNIKDLMTPPGLGGPAGHELYSFKTTHNFFRG